MPELTITLSETKMQALRDMAERLGVSAEELVRAQVESLLGRHDEAFLRAADDVLKRNAELYRRLASADK